MTPTTLRLVIVVSLALAAFVGFRGWKAYSLWRSTGRVQADGAAGEISLLYFSGPNCAQCVTQERIVREVQVAEPGVSVFSYDASVDHAEAARVGVMSVPTTVVIDASGRVLSRNGRLVKADVLVEQLAAAKASSDVSP